MKCVLIAGAMILATLLSAHAAKHHKRHVNDGTVTYDRDSKDPEVGWHTENGHRVCSHDCDNPEIPGSRAVCKNVTVMGMAMRQCVPPTSRALRDGERAGIEPKMKSPAGLRRGFWRNRRERCFTSAR